ncbi:Uu.00g065710.m01.CDS01 [Anthostomella pinea]|uniref:Uu.00g065710.m01.CDS01 n=1 Tax=Anthostomella pinea TaxID=933095 RepID=A0AAI8VN79_9PEZI|nr:Uu.00g065710.m01.CDS01 [Anthostomella pinea]
MSVSPEPENCEFCRSVDWEELVTKPFTPKKGNRNRTYPACGEYNLGTIRSNSSTCELCRLIGNASRALKPWWPIAEFLKQPEQITCAFYSNRNRLGSALQTSGISQANLIVDQIASAKKPGYSSSALAFQELLDSLPGLGIAYPGSDSKTNNSLNCLLVLAGISPVDSNSQTFAQLHPCLYPVPSVDEYAKGTNTFTPFPTGRLIKEEANIQLLKRWYEGCVGSHGDTCSQPSWAAGGMSWPRSLRVIDVNRRCIVDCPEACVFFTLSYVWGNEADPFRATEGNIDALKVAGALESQMLPKTIVDAIHLTREMGVSYLWVDRVCVLQDSTIDKAVQLPQMDLVYSCAALTLVAASGTAVDGIAGINGTPRTINQPTARASPNLSLMNVLRLDQAYQDCTWRTRAWTFQEGLCSRRALVVTADQVYWSCESAKCCESIAFEDFPTAVRPGDVVSSVLSGHGIFQEFGGANFEYSGLDAMIRSYGARKLTVQSDALDAFSGVLNRVAMNSRADNGDDRAFAEHEFHWGHCLSARFEESLAWCNIEWYYDKDMQHHKMPARRLEKRLVRFADGRSLYSVPFPSWSWLGWKNTHGITRAALPPGNVEPELNIMKLDMDGRATALNPQKPVNVEYTCKVDMRGIDASTSAGWKGDTTIAPELLYRGGEEDFVDSGRLLFWTSHAVLDIVSEGKLHDEKGVAVGELSPFWSNRADQPRGKMSFIVVSRNYNHWHSDKTWAEKKLNVLAVSWEKGKHVASRICSGNVDEEAWVGVAGREWILVTLT